MVVKVVTEMPPGLSWAGREAKRERALFEEAIRLAEERKGEKGEGS